MILKNTFDDAEGTVQERLLGGIAVNHRQSSRTHFELALTAHGESKIFYEELTTRSFNVSGSFPDFTEEVSSFNCPTTDHVLCNIRADTEFVYVSSIRHSTRKLTLLTSLA